MSTKKRTNTNSTPYLFHAIQAVPTTLTASSPTSLTSSTITTTSTTLTTSTTSTVKTIEEGEAEKKIPLYFRMPIEEASRILGISSSCIKKYCRRNGISRWPYRKIRSFENKIESLKKCLQKKPNARARIENEIAYYEKQRDLYFSDPLSVEELKRVREAFDEGSPLEDDVLSIMRQSSLAKPTTNQDQGSNNKEEDEEEEEEEEEGIPTVFKSENDNSFGLGYEKVNDGVGVASTAVIGGGGNPNVYFGNFNPTINFNSNGEEFQTSKPLMNTFNDNNAAGNFYEFNELKGQLNEEGNGDEEAMKKKVEAEFNLPIFSPIQILPIINPIPPSSTTTSSSSTSSSSSVMTSMSPLPPLLTNENEPPYLLPFNTSNSSESSSSSLSRPISLPSLPSFFTPPSSFN